MASDSVPIQDPLLFGAAQESDDLEEDVPIDDDQLLSGLESTAVREDAGPLQTTRTDTLASYGQLVAPTTADDSLLFEKEEIEPAERSANGAESSSATPGPPPIKIFVSDPVKKVEQSVIPGVNGGYITYKVTTHTAMPHFTKKEVSVRRRFRDFVALADLLGATHRGYFIPPRPEKNPVEGQRASPDFIEARRAALERYLSKLSEHPVVCKSDEFRVFLEQEGPLSNCYQWQQLQPLQASLMEGVARLPKQVFGNDRAIPAPSEAAQSTRRTSDLLRRFKELGTSMKSDYRKTPTFTLEESTLRGQSTMIEDFQEQLAGASRKAEKMVKKFEEYGNVLGDLGLSLIKVAKFEDEDGGKTGAYTESGMAAKTLSADNRRVGMAAVRLSRLSRTATAQNTIALSVLHDELQLTPSILKALKEREGAMLTVLSLQEDLEKKRGAIAALEEEGSKVFGGDKAKTRKVSSLQSDVAALEAALTAAQAEYDRVKGRNIEELERWKVERSANFGEMLAAYSRIELAFAERGLTIWLGVAEEFGAGKQVAKQAETAVEP